MISSTRSTLANCVRAPAVSALAAAPVLLPATPASAVTFSATVGEDNGATTNANDVANGNTSPDSNQDVYGSPTTHPGILTMGAGAADTGYNFSKSYKSLTSITSLSITLTMLNGSSATAAQETAGGNPTSVADYDVNHLILYLGGTYTAGVLTGGTEILQANGSPLYLNGFLTDVAQSTISFNNITLSTATGSAILAALQSGGGYLSAYVGTNNANDTSPAEGLAGTGTGPAEIFLGNTGDPTTADAVTTLSLLGVPEPGTMALLAAAGALLLPVYRARSRRLIATATTAVNS